MRRIALVLSLVLLPATACHRVRRDPVMACLTGAVAAAESRDADGVMSRVAEGFRDAEGGGKAASTALVRRTLTASESLSLTLSAVALGRGPAAAQAKFKGGMSGRPRAAGGLDGLLPRSSHWSFDVRLEAGTGGWKIAWEIGRAHV